MNIILLGFRGAGKSTLAPLLAKELRWRHIEMDNYIEENVGKSIFDLTNGGTEWLRFRQIEHELFKNSLLKSQNVISTGGGTLVNSIIDPETGQTFGELSRNILTRVPHTLNILLYASDDVIRDRIRNAELAKDEIERPILNHNKAEELHNKLNDLENKDQDISSEKRKSLKKQATVDEILKDSMLSYNKRKPIYEEVADIKIDTGTYSIEQCVQKIIKERSLS